MLKMPTKIETVEDMKKFMETLQEEFEAVRGIHKENMRTLANYFLFLASGIDMAVASGDLEKMRHVLDATRENLRSTASDLLTEKA